MDKNKMLIDATHPEETRVVVLRHGRVEEFDYESASRKLLRGNIYLAKVTRVEPSLQAAFVDYGGNRHGFLAFNEIHPDYYQIPVADRQALLQEEAEEEARAEEEADAAAQARAERRRGSRRSEPIPGYEPQPSTQDDDGPDETVALPAAVIDDEPYLTSPEAGTYADDPAPEPDIAHAEEASPHARESEEQPEINGEVPEDTPSVVEVSASESEEGGVTEVVSANGAEPEQVEQVGTEDAMEEVPERPRRRLRSYKIQEVIKRRQIILVQVVKEERGNKGAALTTYLSLAGRYTVLMPNTGRGGGISRKITNAQDRKRLKSIASELEVPEGMGLIIRTAGAARTKQEIKRDYEYLLRLWESVRDMTLQSTAPCLVYEEGNLIKRSIRDLYTKDIDDIIVAGDAAYREAHDFMSMLQPGGARSVNHYDEPEPLFARYQIERQLNAMFSPYVTLRSGGYLVINQTEALVSIDVNSGKSTREFSIEETALNTNLEAADEIARQVKLRDLAGLIVIDFIDMEEKRNNRAVERRLKDALRHDRARIQVGRISHFGLLEMSRQRLRTGVLEGSTSQCPHCQGTGIVRSTESVALAVLRGLEDELMKGRPQSLTALTTAAVALYILNNKRAFVTDIERRYGISVTVQASERMQGAAFAIERAAGDSEAGRRPERSGAVNMEWGFEGEDRAEETREVAADEEGGGERRGRRRRRRGRRGERGESGHDRERSARRDVGEVDDDHRHHERNGVDLDHDHGHDEGAEHEPMRASDDAGDGGDEHRQARQNGGERGEGEERRGRRRRRGRRGGRNRGEGRERTAQSTEYRQESEPHVSDAEPSGEDVSSDDRNGHAHDTPHAEAQPHTPRASSYAAEAGPSEPEPEGGTASASDDASTAGHAENGTRRSATVEAEPHREPEAEPAHAADADRFSKEESAVRSPPAEEAEEPAQPARRGWWQKRFGGA